MTGAGNSASKTSADDAAASASSTASSMPTFKTVSIIPGIDSTGLLRTLTSSGRGPRPKLRDVSRSSRRILSYTWSQMPSRQPCGSATNSAPTSVVTANAGGTGNPCRRIASMP